MSQPHAVLTAHTSLRSDRPWTYICQLRASHQTDNQIQKSVCGCASGFGRLLIDRGIHEVWYKRSSGPGDGP